MKAQNATKKPRGPLIPAGTSGQVKPGTAGNQPLSRLGWLDLSCLSLAVPLTVGSEVMMPQPKVGMPGPLRKEQAA